MLHQLPPAPCTGFVPRPSDPSAFRLISALEMTHTPYYVNPEPWGYMDTYLQYVVATPGREAGQAGTLPPSFTRSGGRAEGSPPGARKACRSEESPSSAMQGAG